MAGGLLENWCAIRPELAKFRGDMIRACLWREGQSSQKLSQFFDEHHGQLSEYDGIRIAASHSAVLVDHCQSANLRLPAGLAARLGALASREEVRSDIVLEQFLAMENEWERLGIEALALRGPAAALAYYGRPNLRHSHATRWLIESAPERVLAGQYLVDLGWRPLARRIPHAHKQEYVKGGGANLEIHSAPFSWPSLLEAEELLSASFRIVEILGSAKIEQRFANGRWLVDIAGALEKEQVDPQEFSLIAQKCGLAGSCRQGLLALQNLLDQDRVSLVEEIEDLLDHLGDGQDSRAAIWIERVVQKSSYWAPNLVLGSLFSPLQMIHAWRLRSHRANSQYEARKKRKIRPMRL